MAIERPYGRYILEERIALGGMAEIFRARTAAEGFDKKVCIKRVLPHFLESPEFVTMFRDEARLAARLQHANVVQMFDFGEEDGTLYLAMELVDGADLKKLNDRAVRTGRRWSVGQALQVGIEMARGLHHAHSLAGDEGPLHIVHRDISPHNVLVSRAGEVKVTDFGIAKANQRASHTSTGVVKGKLSYMAPEQADGGGVDHRVDQFATALVVWETLCGKKCFDGDNEAQVLRKVLMCEVMRPSAVRGDVPAAVDEVLLKALSPTPEQRYEDMRAFERALTRASFELSDDPSFSDLRPLVVELLDDGANMRKTAVIEEAPKVEPTPASGGDASSVFTNNSEAKEALERAGLAASGGVETVMADATLVSDSPFDASPSVELGNTTEPTRTIVPATTLERDGGGDPSTDVALSDAGEFSAQPEPPAAFPRRGDPEAVIPTERVPRAAGPDAPRSATPMLAALGAVVVVAGIFGVVALDDDDPAATAASSVEDAESADVGSAAGDLAADQPAAKDAVVASSGAAEGSAELAAKAPTEAAREDDPAADNGSPSSSSSSSSPPSEAKPTAAAHSPSRESPTSEKTANKTPTSEPPETTRESQRRRAKNTRAPRSVSRAQAKGKVFVNVVGSWAHVYRGRKKVGTTPTTLTLPAGTQRLKLKNPETGREEALKVTVAPGETVKAIARW